jgi:serine phosphatase RsbU (regulator of sigma subunit)/anti-sigma regulatory factor (Ser/Thr protein kinase)
MPTPIMTCAGGATCRLSVPAELEAVRDSVGLARRFLAEQKLGPQELIACELALVEACNNAVAYSQPASTPTRITVDLDLCCDSNLLEMHVIDHGPGFDWPERIDLPEASEEHGRGLFIIKSLMPEVFYLRGRGQNRLIMRLPRNLREGVELHSENAGVRSSSTTARPGSSRLPGNRTAPVPSNAAAVEDDCTPPPPGLAAVEQKLALSEHVIGTMAKEICFRSEELAAILRSTSELGGGNDLEAFSDRLLNDLLQLAGADWFVLRLASKEGRSLILANASKPELALPPINLDEIDAPPWAERKAALSRSDVFLDEKQPLRAGDPLTAVHPAASGLIKPILMGDTILGTLAIGCDGKQPAFLPSQLQVIHTFGEFLAIQTMNIRLHQEHMDHRLTSRELDIARSIQQSLLPKTFPKLTGYGLSGFCLNARQVGGDFFDVLPLSQEKVLLVIADVMGKGVPAALFAATLRTLVRTVVEWTHRPAEILERVNRLIYDELSGVDMFITAQVAVADTHKRRLLAANAGHCPLLLTRQDNTIEAVSPEGMPFGILADTVFEQVAIPLAEYTSVVLYTDGLTEARNAHGEFFGQERFFDWLRQNQPRTASKLSEAFRAELKSFQGQIALSDDQTLLVLAEETEQEAGIEELRKDKASLFKVPARAVAPAQR